MKKLPIIAVVLPIAVLISFLVGLSIGKSKAAIVYTPAKNVSDSLKKIDGTYQAVATGQIVSLEQEKITVKNNQYQTTFALSRDLKVTGPIIAGPKTTLAPTINIGKQPLPVQNLTSANLNLGQNVSLKLLISQKDIFVESIHIITYK